MPDSGVTHTGPQPTNMGHSLFSSSSFTSKNYIYSSSSRPKVRDIEREKKLTGLPAAGPERDSRALLLSWETHNQRWPSSSNHFIYFYLYAPLVYFLCVCREPVRLVFPVSTGLDFFFFWEKGKEHKESLLYFSCSLSCRWTDLCVLLFFFSKTFSLIFVCL